MATLRHLVPVLGIIALIPALHAEEKAPVVTFSGWSDNIFNISDDNAEQVGGPTAKSTQAPTTRFTAAASLKAAWKVGDKVSGKINAWFYPADGSANKSPIVIREAFALYQVSESIGLQMGKYIDHIGWISPEPMGLYVVNPDVIGYRGNTYGNDVLGAAILFSPKDQPFLAQLHVTNGYYTGSDAYSYNYDATTTNTHRANSDMGWGLDLTYVLPGDKGNINLEAAYDTHSDTNAKLAEANSLGGNVAYVGLNLTLKPVKDLTIGFEAQARQTGKGKLAGDVDYGGKEKIYQGMLLANYVLPGTPFPMSVTLNDQYIVKINDDKFDDAVSATVAYDDQNKCRQNLIQAVLLTNPTGSTNFGVNLEIGYYQKLYDERASADASHLTGWETAVEALITF